MATNESSEPQGSLESGPEGHYITSDASMVSEHGKTPRTLDTGLAVAEVKIPRDVSVDMARHQKDDPLAHPNSSRIVQDIADIDLHTPREAGEPPFREAMPQRTCYDEQIISKMKGDVAGIFSSVELYDIYVRKLQKLRETGDPANTLDDQGKPKILVRSLIDYLSSYEERMKTVEDKLGIVQEPETPKKMEGKVESDIAGTKFYNVDDHVGASTYAYAIDDAEDDWNSTGAFCSTVDANHRIRALFRWKNKPNDIAADIQQPPDPKSVDIVELRIKSKPVAAFFQKELDYDISNDGLIHIIKPFRCLITKADLIRQHVSRVEEQLRGLTGDTTLSSVIAPDTVDNASSESGTIQNASATTGTSESSPDSLESEVAAVHLKELLDFIDSYLHVDIALFQEYKNGNKPNVTFSNLWMLFDSTDTIFCPSKKGGRKIHAEEDATNYFVQEQFETPQVYRVLASLGGNTRRTAIARHKKSSRTSVERKDDNSSPHIREQWTSLYVDCYFIEFDGVGFRAVDDAFEFKPFPGEVSVTSLQAYPFQYHTSVVDGGKESLIQRGAYYADLISVQHVNHKGLTLGDPKEEINSPVIVDFKSAYEHEPAWQPELTSMHIVFWQHVHNTILEIPKRTCSHVDCHKIICLDDVSLLQQREAVSKRIRDVNIVLDDYKLESKEQIEKFKEDMKLQDLLHLVPGRTYAFALRNRKWVVVDLKNLGKVKQEDNWKDLILPPGHKEMVQAMVENFTSTGSAAGGIGSRDDLDMDLVPGKGKGCIILLHGEPGVGKTSTAECVAAYTRRPLYPITCGDIGTTPSEVEYALDSHFSRAHKWGCVLLLDEADVFLAKRNKFGDDIKRNGLVSIFLRTLEYYSGILFLTTNRVGSFDDAFRSRIHVQLYYPKLTDKQALKIWKTNISRLQRQNEDRKNMNLPEVYIDRRKIVSFAKNNFDKLRWNGRQIRNGFQTAVALAVFESRKELGKKPEVTKRHFQKVAAATSDFEEYLRQLNMGLDEEKMARRDQDRVVYTPVATRFKSFDTVDDYSSSGSDSSSSSDEETTEVDSLNSESEEEKMEKSKKKKKEGEKKSKKSRKTRDSEKATQKE